MSLYLVAPWMLVYSRAATVAILVQLSFEAANEGVIVFFDGQPFY